MFWFEVIPRYSYKMNRKTANCKINKVNVIFLMLIVQPSEDNNENTHLDSRLTVISGFPQVSQTNQQQAVSSSTPMTTPVKKMSVGLKPPKYWQPQLRYWSANLLIS